MLHSFQRISTKVSLRTVVRIQTLKKCEVSVFVTTQAIPSYSRSFKWYSREVMCGIYSVPIILPGVCALFCLYSLTHSERPIWQAFANNQGFIL